MSMAILQFYKNKYRYPKYSNTLTAYGSPMDCTPVGINLRSGTLRVKGNLLDFMSCNYLALTMDGVTLYAWIEDVRFRTEDSFEVSYSVDAWRTYKSKIDLGTQFIARRPEWSLKKDNLLGGSVDYPQVSSVTFPIGDNPSQRVFVVQIRTGEGSPFSRTPVNPSPYQFFLRAYDVNNWTADSALNNLMSRILYGAEPSNLVTMYSIPYADLSQLLTVDLPLYIPNNPDPVMISGFKMLNSTDPSTLLRNESYFSIIGTTEEDLLITDHSVQIVIPEAGIIHVPDELLMKKQSLALRQDVDLFSGACNYMLTVDGQPYTQSVRGSSISSIPIVSDPLDTYLSQNQNALATSLIGDVASIAAGVAMVTPFGRAATGLGAVGTAFGGSTAMSGINNIISREAQQSDMANRYSNPPAFLGTALASNFNQLFWVVWAKKKVDNAVKVNTNFGYPWGIVDTLVFPSAGFIQTEGCAVESTDGSVPKWALDEINSMFNNGVLVK